MKISIIIPIYNTQKLLSRSIESVLCQEYTNFELILTDDGSTDNSPAICEKYAQNDKKSKADSHRTNVYNQGLSTHHYAQ